MTVHRCPICKGTGRMRPSFYPDIHLDTVGKWVKCRACGGSGIIVDRVISHLPPLLPTGHDDLERRRLRRRPLSGA